MGWTAVQPDGQQCGGRAGRHSGEDGRGGYPVYGSEVEQVKLGCVGGAGLDYIQLGIQTGLMAAKVLTGEAACEDLPYETIENYGLYINSDAAADGHHHSRRHRPGGTGVRGITSVTSITKENSS